MASKNMQSIATKVSAESHAKLQSICQRYGFSMYDMLQMFCDCMIRFMDDQHNLDYSIIRIIRMFGNIPGWKKAFRLVEDMEDAEITEAFYVLNKKGQTGYRLIHVTRPMLEGDENGWEATCNIQHQLERFMELTDPVLYRHLRMLAVELETESMFDTIWRVADCWKEAHEEDQDRRIFESNDWHKGHQMHQEKVRRDLILKQRKEQEEQTGKLFEVETNPNKEEEQ